MSTTPKDQPSSVKEPLALAEGTETPSELVVVPAGPIDNVEDVAEVNPVHAQVSRMKSLIDMIERQSGLEDGLRRTTAIAFMALFALEIIAIFVAFFLYGAGVLKFEPWSAEAFLSLALIQSATLLGYIVKYLFPDRVNDVVRLMEAELNARFESGDKDKKP